MGLRRHLHVTRREKHNAPLSRVSHGGLLPCCFCREGWSGNDQRRVQRYEYGSATNGSTNGSCKTSSKGGQVYKGTCAARKRVNYGEAGTFAAVINRRPIAERPAEVEARSRMGDWKPGHHDWRGPGAIVTLVERQTGYARLMPPNRELQGDKSDHQALVPGKMTFDNGEFASRQWPRAEGGVLC